MKRIAVLLVLFGLSAAGCVPVLARPTLPNNTAWHWDNVVALPSGALIRVTTSDRQSNEGTFVGADLTTLHVQTEDGPLFVPASLVRRVERVQPRRGHRARSALVAAGAGAAVVLAADALACRTMSGESCVSPKSLATIAAFCGLLGAMPESRAPMTIYMRR
jgi:hypothetical protein